MTAGLLSGFLAAIFSISDATFIFGLSLPAALPAGIGLALLSTAILASVTAMTSSIPGVVAQTQEVPLATLAVVAAAIPAMMPPDAGEAAVFTTLLCTLGLSTLATGVFFFLLGQFRLGLRIDREDDMEIPIADMPENGRGDRRRLEVGLGLADALRQAADRHAHVGRPADCARTQVDRRVICLVPGLPQLGAFLGQIRPAEVAAAIRRRELAHGLRLFVDIAW